MRDGAGRSRAQGDPGPDKPAPDKPAPDKPAPDGTDPNKSGPGMTAPGVPAPGGSAGATKRAAARDRRRLTNRRRLTDGIGALLPDRAAEDDPRVWGDERGDQNDDRRFLDELPPHHC